MNKPFLTVPQQLELLKARGLEIDLPSPDRALYDANYYRFSGYARQFQADPSRGDNTFESGTSLARIMNLMRIDDALRRLLFEGLTIVETTMRSRFAHEAGRVHGNRAFYLEHDSYLDITPNLGGHVSKLESELRRPSPSVARYRSGGDLSAVPIWVAVEVVSFGMLARMIQYFEDSAAARATAESLSVPWIGFQSTVHAFAVLRNACAHHAQLWHRPSGIPAAPAKKDRRFEPPYDANGRSLYAAVIALKRYLAAIDRHADFPRRVDELLAADALYAEGIYFPRPR